MELPILAVAFYGLRRNEIIGLRWNTIDFERKTIRINHTVVQTILNRRTKIIQKDETKTVSDYRTLLFVLLFEKPVFKAKEVQIQNRQSYGRDYCKEYLDRGCVDSMGHLLKRNFVTQHFSLLLEMNGLKRYVSTICVIVAPACYKPGGGLKKNHERFRYSDIETTTNIYTY